MRGQGYTKKVTQRFLKPKFMGEMKNPDAIGIIQNPICKDTMKIYLKIDKKTIQKQTALFWYLFFFRLEKFCQIVIFVTV